MAYNPYQQSIPAYGAGSKSSTPTAQPVYNYNVPGYAPGATQSTIKNPGPGVVSNPLSSQLSGLYNSIMSLYTILGQMKSSPSVGNTGGGSSTYGGGASIGGGTSVGGGNPAIVAPSNPPISLRVSPSVGQSYTSTPYTGLVNELSFPNKGNLNNSQSTLFAKISEGNPEVSTRSSWWDKIKQIFGPNRPWEGTAEQLRKLPGGLYPLIGTTKPSSPEGSTTNVNTGFTAFSYNPNPSLGNNTLTDTTKTPSGNTELTLPSKETSTGIGSSTWDTTTHDILNQLNELQTIAKGLSDKAEQLKNIEANLDQPDNQDAQPLLLSDIAADVATYKTKAANLSTQIDDIDNILQQAAIGFRKTAEDIRNNPDFTVWQQARRLRELEDLQNYAPIFNGLSYKDLVAYREQLANSYNAAINNYNDTIKNVVTLQNQQIQLKESKYNEMINTLNIQKSILDLQSQVANYGYSTIEKTDTQGNQHRVVIYTDPNTKKQTIISDIIVGYATPKTTYKVPSAGALQGYADWFKRFETTGMTPADLTAIKIDWVANGYDINDFNKYFNTKTIGTTEFSPY